VQAPREARAGVKLQEHCRSPLRCTKWGTVQIDVIKLKIKEREFQR